MFGNAVFPSYTQQICTRTPEDRYEKHHLLLQNSIRNNLTLSMACLKLLSTITQVAKLE